jgi:two-component system, OmpR family, response regulator ResD
VRCDTRPMERDSRGSVLVVEDEPTIAEVVSRYLGRAGYRTRTAADGPRALGLAESERPDLVVLDLMLPRMDGLEVMRRLRDQGRDRLPVILLTAKGEESDRVIGLRLGADDYVVKPFSPAELVARADAVLRRTEGSADQELAVEFDELPDCESIHPHGGCSCANMRRSSHTGSSSFCCSSSGIPGRPSPATS